MNSLLDGMWGRVAVTVSLVLAMSGATAGDVGTPAAGAYCPAAEILDVVVEELSVSLDQLMSAQNALASNDAVAADMALGRAASALALASARGRAARTTRLLDAVLAAKAGEDYTQLLAWFPALHSAFLTLPESAAVSYAGTELGMAEEVLQGDREGNALEHLRAARHYLSCDTLDLPLQQADEALVPLYRTVVQGRKADAGAFTAVSAPLRSALQAALQKVQSPDRR